MEIKEKNYYRTNVFWIIFCVFCYFISHFGLFAIIVGIVTFLDFTWIGSIERILYSVLIMMILVLGTIFFSIYTIKTLKFGIIHLTKDKMYLTEDGNSKRKHIQFYTEVKFSEIELIDIIWMSGNSNGKPTNSNSLSDFNVRPFISIKTKKGETKNFSIMFMHKKIILKLINDIKNRANLLNNDFEIITEDEIIRKLKRTWSNELFERNKKN